jgi:flagellar biosynthetic protein FliR
MIDWNSMTEAQILLFALVLLRMLAFVISSAIFGSPSISTPIKVLLSIAISVVIFPSVRAGSVDYSLVSGEIIGLAARELIIGLSLGFLTRLFFFAVTMTGDLVAISVGLSSAQLYNPMMGTHGNTVDQFYSTIGTLIFLVINGHHYFLAGIVQSYELVPVSSLALKVGVFAEMAVYGQTVMLMAIKMCAPVLVTIFLANVAMGILGRAVPQINVLVTSMPVTIMLGMAVVFLCLPLLVIEMGGLAEITAGKLFEVMKQL